MRVVSGKGVAQDGAHEADSATPTAFWKNLRRCYVILIRHVSKKSLGEVLG